MKFTSAHPLSPLYPSLTAPNEIHWQPCTIILGRQFFPPFRRPLTWHWLEWRNYPHARGSYVFVCRACGDCYGRAVIPTLPFLPCLGLCSRCPIDPAWPFSLPGSIFTTSVGLLDDPWLLLVPAPLLAREHALANQHLIGETL